MLNHTTTAHTASESGVILYVFPQTAWITEDYIIDQNLKILCREGVWGEGETYVKEKTVT